MDALDREGTVRQARGRLFRKVSGLVLAIFVLHFVFDEPTRSAVFLRLFRRPIRASLNATVVTVPMRILPNQGFLSNGSFEKWQPTKYDMLEDWEVKTTLEPWGAVRKEAGIVKSGEVSACLLSPGREDALSQSLDRRLDELRGHAMTFSAWAHSLDREKPCLEIDDGVNRSVSCTHTGSGQWERLTLSHQVSPEAPQLEFRIRQGRASHPIYVDDAAAVHSAPPVSQPPAASPPPSPAQP